MRDIRHLRLTKTGLMLMCGAIGCSLFVLVFLMEGAARTGYSALRHPVSSLAIGEFGWVQVTNFMATGLLLFAFAIGLRAKLPALPGKAPEPLLLGLVAIGLIGSGFFTTDPVYGYPADQPFISGQFSIMENCISVSLYWYLWGCRMPAFFSVSDLEKRESPDGPCIRIYPPVL